MISIKDISRAQLTTAKHITVTPLIFSNTFSSQFNRKIYFKCESFQRTGSFKFRSALNRFLQLNPEEKKRGVITPCYGNYAQAAAVSAAIVKCNLTTILPEDESSLKKRYVETYGATTITHGHTFEDALSQAEYLAETQGKLFFHPYEDPAMIAGAGTIALEILEQNPDTEAIVVPVGGGSLLAGIATAIKEKKAKVAVIGVQPQVCSPFYMAYHSKTLESTTPPANTIADSLKIAQVSAQNYEIAQNYVDDFLVVSEESLIQSMVQLLEQGHLVVEGAGATPLAALIEDKVSSKYRNVTLILSGGNVQTTSLSKIIHHGLAKWRRIIRLDILSDDAPGRLNTLAQLLHQKNVNIIQIYQNRFLFEEQYNRTRIQLILETDGETPEEEILSLLKENNFEVETRGK